MSVEEVIGLLKKLKTSSKSAFLSAILVGIISHGYAFSNKLPNSDDILNIRAYGGGISHGCWLKGLMGPIISKFAGNYSTPWLIGMISILLIAAAAVVVVDTLKIESAAGGIIVGGVLTSFPAITGNFLFMYMAAYFSLSIFMTSIAVYFIVHKKSILWTMTGVIFIAFSMGIYQAYFPFAAGLLICNLIRKCFCEKERIILIWKEAIKYFFCLLFGIVLYFLIEYLCIRIFHEPLGAHKGINEMGHIDLHVIPEIVVQMYRNMMSMLYSDYMGMSSDLMIRILIGISYLTVSSFVVINGIRLIKKREYLKAASGLFFFMIFPIAINLIDIMCASSEKSVIYILMEYALVLIFILPVMLLDAVKKTLLHWGMLLCGIGIISCYANLANEAYLYVDLAQRAVESYYTVMVAEIRGTEDYRSDMDIVFVGNIEDATIYPLRQEFQNLGICSVEDVTERVNWYKENFLKYYCGFTSTYKENYKEEYKEIVMDMPCYPDYGSIKVLGEEVIVKLSD